MLPESDSADRRAIIVIVVLSFLAYAYFFQGIAWNAMAHFDTIRAMAEHGTAVLHASTEETGDVCIVQGRRYSNKPPGLALLGVVPYRLIIAIERARGIDIDAHGVMVFNLRLCTILLAAMPAALLNGLIFCAFRRDDVSRHAAMLLSGGFAFGSLSWPYAGHLMSHALCALLVFATWLLLSAREVSKWMMWLAGALAAYAAFTDLLILPVTLSLVLIPAMRRQGWKRCIGYCVCCCVGTVAVLGYNRLVMGAFQGGQLVPMPNFSKAGLLFGQFDFPEWRRLYWITFQPMRGLFPTCPAFIICALAVFTGGRPKMLSPSRWAIVTVLCVYAMFYLTFFGWHGGAGVGPRYFIPGLPLLWMFARRPFAKFPRICGVVIALSIFQMFAVAAVGMLFPNPLNNLPDDSDPIRSDTIVLVQGHVNSDRDTENLGSLLHVPERFQLLPILALLAGFYCRAWTPFWTSGNSLQPRPKGRGPRGLG